MVGARGLNAMDVSNILTVKRGGLGLLDHHISILSPGFVSCKKKNRNAKNMASAGARDYMGSGQRVRGTKPPVAECILLPKRANLLLSFK